ncbi:putative ferric-chelate reductase 1 homolog [Homalodisca vitripennis]|uniref:putative ferric-chelate reductase 1 homolog n=1 Tax=Homalodisca vitripennis TaxID=197043 RepID=UPI001EEC9A4F|nr:putative ferric-chelate reductase 1 homolog [Homalodisca vitripennis]
MVPCSMHTLAMVLWMTKILLEVKGQEYELWDPWADNCESMVPCNLTEPQTDLMPYIVTLNRPYINSDQAVYVYIRALPPLSFQGFMIQARDDKTGQAVGEFDTDNRKISVINCFGRPDSTAMHADNSPKTEVTARWAPEDDNDATVTFYVTIAEKFNPLVRFWACQRTKTLQIIK